MDYRRIAVIMAGGSGQRFWPVSTAERPKQFLRLTSPDKSLLQEAVGRAAALFGVDSTYIATGVPLAKSSLESCPELPAGNVLAEPAKRNTTGCLAWVAANLIARNPTDWSDISIAVLTADQRISPDGAFHDTVTKSLGLAEETGGLVTIGIRPDRPETGYGYIELGKPVLAGRVAKSFREKPDATTAQAYFASGEHLWNSGMFFWTLTGFLSEMDKAEPSITSTIRDMAQRIKEGDDVGAERTFETLPSLSIDYALMEKAKQVYVVEAQFSWDDLGAWDSLRRSYPPDGSGNVSLGPVRFVESSDCIVYNESGRQEVCLLGLQGMVVVVTDGQILVCPADQAQDVRKVSS